MQNCSESTLGATQLDLLAQKRGKLYRGDVIELVLNYLVFSVYGTLLYFVGGERLAWGMLPSLVIVSHLSGIRLP